MPQRYNWRIRRSRNVAGSSTESTSPIPDGDSSSQTSVNNSSPAVALASSNLDLATALVPPSRGEDYVNSIHERQETDSPSYMITSSHNSNNSQTSKSPSFIRQQRRFVDDEEEGSSIYFISEPSLSEDCRSVEYSNGSPTSDLYTDHAASDGILRPYFSPMQLVRRKRATKLLESPTSDSNSIEDSTEDLITSGVKLHTAPSSYFERESSDSSDEELERILPNDLDLEKPVIFNACDGDNDSAERQDRGRLTRDTYNISSNHHQGYSPNVDGSLCIEHQEPTPLMKTDHHSQYSSYPRTDVKKRGNIQRWLFHNVESNDERHILHPLAVRSPLHIEQPLTSRILPQILSNERIAMTQNQSSSDPFIASSTNGVTAANADIEVINSNNHPAQLTSGIIPDSDSTSTLSSPDSARSQSSSSFSWISKTKKIQKIESIEPLNNHTIAAEDGPDLVLDRRILNSSMKENIHIPNEASSPQQNFPRQSSASHFSFFETEVTIDEAKKFPTFVCPRCKTRQREFFTVTTVPGQFESPAGYLAIYFTIYVVASLYIFGLEEGWPALDCVYFSVITLTTTGLGDFVPTSDGAKIVCSIFIYFGVACIGLLLGSLLANSLDESSRRVARETMINNCPNCVRFENNRMLSIPRDSLSEGGGRKQATTLFSSRKGPLRNNATVRQPNTSILRGDLIQNQGRRVAQAMPLRKTKVDNQTERIVDRRKRLSTSSYTSQNTASSLQSSTTVSSSGSHGRFLTRQSRTRHNSIDLHSVGGAIEEFFASKKNPVSAAKLDSSLKSSWHYESVIDGADENSSGSNDDGDDVDSDSSDDFGSTSSEEDAPYNLTGIKSARYVFLTLKQAVANSVLIIAIGSLGFYYIEEMSAVNSFYFTTVLLTTVGYGDIVPQTSWGKLFATVYVLVAGTVLLRNMSMISMIPLELRKRRLERAVLRQFGDKLDEATLRELANGPLVRRLQISEDRPDGLKQCTREMFALVMLIRLGKITEQDVRSTFAAFHKLDLDRDGRLSSKEIIMSAVEEERKRGMKNREDLSKSVISKSPEKRSILFKAIGSSQILDTTDQRPIENTATEESKYLLPRKHSSQAQNKLDYGSSGGGEEDIEAGRYDGVRIVPPIAQC